jgi:hypothetical protein
MEAVNPRFNITVAGKKYGLQFDVNDRPTKKGIRMQFILDQEFEDPRDKQALAGKISIALQKRFGDAGIMIDFDDRTAYRNVIGFIVPIDSIANMLVKILKGG